MKRMRNLAFAVAMGLSSFLLQSCPASSIITDCFGEGTISKSEYEDLNFIEKEAYERNSCGRYEPRSGWVSDLLDLF